jgi:hypothetical protein
MEIRYPQEVRMRKEASIKPVSEKIQPLDNLAQLTDMMYMLFAGGIDAR